MEAENNSARQVRVVMVPVDCLKHNPHNERIYSRDSEAEDRLEKEITQDGYIRDPFIVTKDNTVADGNRRLAIARKLGIKEVPVAYISADSDDALLINSVTHNCRKRKLTPSELFRAIDQLWPVYEANVHGSPSAGHMSREARATRTRELVGADVCLEGRQVQRYRKTMQQLVECDPDAWERIKSRPDCYEEAVRIVRASQAKGAQDCSADAVITKSLTNLRVTIEAATKLRELAAEMRPKEVRDLKAFLAALGVLVDHIQATRAQSRSEVERAE